MGIYKDAYKLAKQANVFGSIANGVTSLVSGTVGAAAAVADKLLQFGATGLVAAATLGGIGLGFSGAKITAHDDKDIENARKAYTDARLSADLGYLSQKVKQEYANSKTGKPKRSARILN